jgi:hypothetical protein
MKLGTGNLPVSKPRVSIGRKLSPKLCPNVFFCCAEVAKIKFTAPDWWTVLSEKKQTSLPAEMKSTLN